MHSLWKGREFVGKAVEKSLRFEGNAIGLRYISIEEDVLSNKSILVFFL